MKVEIIAKETIKPSSPTPHHLRTLNFSVFDLVAPPFYNGVVLFYCNNHVDLRISKELSSNVSAEISQKLKLSLSQTLTCFYPLAGRLERESVDCNDEGAVFIEARVDCLLKDFLENPDPVSVKLFLPAQLMSIEAAVWPVLLVQATFFGCGGFGIGVCISHKISDTASLGTFLRGWAAATTAVCATQGYGKAVIPQFNTSTVFPPVKISIIFPEPDNEPTVRLICVTKRFVFDAPKITELKTIVQSIDVKDPTRVEAVFALLWKCLTNASRSRSGILRPSVVQLPVDLRRRVKSLLPETTMGNLTFLFFLRNEERMELQEAVIKMRQKKEELNGIPMESSVLGKAMADGIGNFLCKGIDAYNVTSWCRMPFYETDFGYGNPIWAATGFFSEDTRNFIVLMDTRDGKGIEAWVTLTKEDMFIFENDKELLAFASPNPSILV